MLGFLLRLYNEGVKISTFDIFMSVVVISFIMGIVGLSFSYLDVLGIGTTSSIFNQTYTTMHLPPNQAIQTLSSNLYQFSFVFPTIAAIATLLLIIESWMLSFFIKAHPLAAVGAIAMLVVYTLVSFYVSNASIGIIRLPVFQAIVNSGSANLLIVIWLNMPIILLFSSIVDIAIAFTASRQ